MKKRYSFLIRPLQVILDVLLILLIIYFIGNEAFLNLYFITYILLFWLIASGLTGFYKVYRFTRILRVANLLFQQFLLFTLGFFAFFGIFKESQEVGNQFITLALIVTAISMMKLIWFYLLKKYRALGKNFRTTVVVGFDQSSKDIIKLFKSKSNLGYRFLGFFSDKEYKNKDYKGNLANLYSFVKEQEVDEIYCSLSYLNNQQVKAIKKFALDENRILKLIPETSELYSKSQNVEFYDDALMVLNVKKLPFDFPENFYIKRLFDMLFSLLICVFILSWLYPILWVLIKLESRGPVIFKQKREGLNGDDFICYKFRSMKMNAVSDKVHAKKNDNRVTKIGAFLRKTSIDELPQFLNVLKGDMSIVGPRPHLESLSFEYQKDVDNYMKRHIVKPGITGLAQISGYRGEILSKSDIKNRIRLDIFYIENWSFYLDLKIIIQTILNIFRGEEKAY